MAEGEILISVDTDGFLDPKLWGSLIHTFSLGPTDTKLDPFWCFFLMAKGEILISVDTDGFLDPNCGGSLIHTFSLGPTDTKPDPFWCFFLMAKGEIFISVDTDGFLDPKLWGVVNAHFFSRTNGHQGRPILVLFLNGRRWNFDFHQHRWIPWPKIVGGSLIHTFSLGPTDTKLNPFWCFFLMAEGEILISSDTDGFLDPKLWGVVN